MNDSDGRAKERIARRFDRVASTYGQVEPRFFASFGRRLVERVGVPSQSHVLDIATGRGAVLYPAAKRAGPHGRVVGIDLSADMVRETAAELERMGLQNAQVRHMDAEDLDFSDGSFDVVLCGLAISFFPRPCRALGEMRRVLRPGGRVGITTFARDSEHLGWAAELLRACEPSAEAPTEKGEDRPSRPALDAPSSLEAALSGAGFEGNRVFAEETSFVYQDEEALWSAIWCQAAHGVLAPPALARLKADVLRQARAFRQPDGIRPPPFRVLYALGTKLA